MAYNSTIISKKKKCVNCGTVTYLFSKGKCKQCATIDSTNKRIEKSLAQEDNYVDSSIKDLIEDLDRVVSRYIRLKEADSLGNTSCYTCGKKGHYLKMQCSHFIPRSHMATRFLESNLACACKQCNEGEHGNLEVYAANLEKDSKGTVEYLNELKHTIEKPTREDLKQLLTHYQSKLKIVESKLKK